MKVFTALVLFMFMSNVDAGSCDRKAKEIAVRSMDLFKIQDVGIHCMALGKMAKFTTVPLMETLPPKYGYTAEFDFPCGPTPHSPKVFIMLNGDCNIVKLEMMGHDL